MSKKSERQKELEAMITALDKQFGKGTIMRMGDDPVERVPVFSTGSLTLDHLLGVGGIPQGRIIEIFGPESSG